MEVMPNKEPDTNILDINVNEFIAHVRKSDKAKQSVKIHLQGTAELAKGYAEKLGLPLSGEIIGLFHNYNEWITNL